MALKLQLINAGQQAVTIFDETQPRPQTDFCHDGFCPEAVRLFHNTNLVRGAAPFIADRYNMYSRWSFTVTHAFGSAQKCQDFIGNRAAILRTGELQIFFYLGGAAWQRFYKTAYLTAVKPVRDKVFQISVDYEYELQMNSLFSVTP